MLVQEIEMSDLGTQAVALKILQKHDKKIITWTQGEIAEQVGKAKHNT
jgi:hypothetical protein